MIITDTIAGSSAKRHVGIRMSIAFLITHEAFRIETFRVGKLYRISVKRVRNHGDGRPSWNHVAICLSVPIEGKKKEICFQEICW
jgi:hypothetical protein